MAAAGGAAGLECVRYCTRHAPHVDREQAAMTTQLLAAPFETQERNHAGSMRATLGEKRTRPPKKRAKAYIRLSAVWLVIAR